MNTYLKVNWVPYEEPRLVRVVVRMSSGRLATTIEVYEEPGNLLTYGGRLAVFPQSPNDECAWELGSESPGERAAYYLCLRVRAVNSRGTCVLSLRTNNNRPYPYMEVCELALQAEPGQINRLGELFRKLSSLDYRGFLWEVTSGQLIG